MRHVHLTLVLGLLGCSGQRFETLEQTDGDLTTEDSPTTEEKQPDNVNVEVNVEVNVDGQPVASASATNGSSAPEGEDSGFIHLPVPTSYVPEPPDAAPHTESTEPATDGGIPSLPPAEPVPVLVLSDDVDTFRDWFLVGYDFDSQRFERVQLAVGGFAAHATVTGNRDYTVVGTLFDGPHGEPRAAADFDGVAFWTCGTIGALRFEVPTTQTEDASQHFGKLVDVTPQWQLVTLRWSDLGQDTPTHTFDLESVRGLFFTVVDETYELGLAHVQFWTEGEPLAGEAPTGSCVTP